MKSWFLQKITQRSCWEKNGQDWFNSVRDMVRSELVKAVVLVVTYYPSFNRLNMIIKDKPYLLHIYKEVKKTFSINSTLSFRSARKLNTYVVLTKIYTIEKKVGSYCRNKNRYQICVSVNESLVSFWILKELVPHGLSIEENL